MRLIITGCEYAGTTTLAEGVQQWVGDNLGVRMLIHDHWKVPNVSGHPPMENPITILTEEEKRQVMAMTPKVKELLTRYTLYYHTLAIPDGDTEPGMIVLGYYFDEMVYGPLYFGYGGPDEPGDRRVEASIIEQRTMKLAPETVLVLVKASPETIARRMAAAPRPDGVLRKPDIERVSRRFDELFDASTIARKIVVDTTGSSAKSVLETFLSKLEPYWTEADRLRMLTRNIAAT